MARRQKENNKTGSKAPANPKSKHRPPISKGKPANPPTIPSSPASKDKLLAEQKTASSDHLGEHANSTSITAGTSSGTPSSPHGPNQSTDVAAGGTSRTLRKPVEVDLDNIARWKKVKEGNWLPQSARTTKRARERNNEHDLILLMSASKKQKAETNANAQASKQAGKTADSLGPDVGHTAELSTQTSKSFMRPKATPQSSKSQQSTSRATQPTPTSTSSHVAKVDNVASTPPIPTMGVLAAHAPPPVMASTKHVASAPRASTTRGVGADHAVDLSLASSSQKPKLKSAKAGAAATGATAASKPLTSKKPKLKVAKNAIPVTIPSLPASSTAPVATHPSRQKPQKVQKVPNPMPTAAAGVANVEASESSNSHDTSLVQPPAAVSASTMTPKDPADSPDSGERPAASAAPPLSTDTDTTSHRPEASSSTIPSADSSHSTRRRRLYFNPATLPLEAYFLPPGAALPIYAYDVSLSPPPVAATAPTARERTAEDDDDYDKPLSSDADLFGDDIYEPAD